LSIAARSEDAVSPVRTATRTAGAASLTFSYDGNSDVLAAQQSGSTTTNLVRGPAGMLLAEVPAGGTALRVNPTIHGDIGRLVNSGNGATAWSAVYDPFGAATTTGSAPVSLGFQSMFSDPGSGLVDMGARSYNPATGTFTSADSVIGEPMSPVTLNRYLYGNGNPVGSFDLEFRSLVLIVPCVLGSGVQSAWGASGAGVEDEGVVDALFWGAGPGSEGGG